MTPTTCQWRLAAAGGEGSDNGDGGAAADLAGRNDYEDYTNRGVGKDDAPLDDGQRKRIRRMGMM